MPSKPAAAPAPEEAPADADAKVVEKGDLVQVHFVGMLEDDSVFDSSQGREPLAFEVGAGEVIEGFEEGVLGMQVGQTKRVVIPPEAGYGPWRDELLAQVDRAMAGGQDVMPGMAVQVRTPEDEVMEATVTEVTDESLTLDFNHPLAGKVLTFEVTLVGFREPE